MTPFLPIKRFGEHCEILRSFKGRLYSGAVASKDGLEFALIRCGMGGRFMGDAVLLLGATPVREIIFAGSCGGLKDCGTGDLLVCENAFNGEGFARYHTPDFSMKSVFDSGELIPADPGYTENLKKFVFERAGDKAILKTGNVFTIGSLAAECRENVPGIEQKGFAGIDLELSAVYHAARATGQKAAGLAFVSDLPLKKPMWDVLTPEERSACDAGIAELARLSVGFVSKKEEQ